MKRLSIDVRVQKAKPHVIRGAEVAAVAEAEAEISANLTMLTNNKIMISLKIISKMVTIMIEVIEEAAVVVVEIEGEVVVAEIIIKTMVTKQPPKLLIIINHQTKSYQKKRQKRQN